MKNFKISLPTLSFLAALVFFSCDTNTIDDSQPVLEKNSNLAVGIINDAGEVLDTEIVTPNNSKVPSNINFRKSPNLNVNGNFTTDTGSLYEFSAIMNNSGVQGEVEIHSVINGHVVAETVCVSAVDNEAVFAWRIISVENPTPYVQENFIWVFKVKDNGEGANHDPDQRSWLGLVYYNWFNFYDTAEDFIADRQPCTTDFYSDTFSTYFDVTEGQIQVR